MGLSGDDLAVFVARSCAAQGVPVRLSDAGVVRRVVALLGGDPPAKAAEPPADGAPLSELPDDVDSVGVELPSAGFARSDHDVVNDSRHDRSLAGEIEFGPPAA